MHQLFANNAQNTTLAAGIGPLSNTLTLSAGDGEDFPIIPANSGEFFVATLNSATNPNQPPEIILVTGHPVGDVFTQITRAWENTGPSQQWNAGDYVSMNPTRGTMENFIQPDILQEQPGNFANDTGAANAYIGALNPPLTAHVVGMPIRFFAVHTNTGTSTFNDGAGAAPILFPGGVALGAGVIFAGSIYEVVWNEQEYFELIGGGAVIPPQLATAIAGAIVAAQQFVVSQAQPLYLEIPTETGIPVIVQAGIISGVNGGAGPVTVTLPFSLPHKCVAFFGSSKRTVVGADTTVGTGQTQNTTNTAGADNYGLSQNVIVCDRDADGTQRASWCAIGY